MLADDEGTDNSVDMDRFFVYANGFNSSGPGDPGVQFNPVDEQVFGWSTPGWFEMGDGSPTCLRCHRLAPAGLRLRETPTSPAHGSCLKAWCRDYDSGGTDENGYGTITLIGDNIWGPHEIDLYSSDFHFRCYVDISPGN